MHTIAARWQRLDQTNLPSARAGHVAASIDKRDEWGVELVVIHGGVNSDKDALDDFAVLQVSGETSEWLDIAVGPIGPAARAFHCGAAIANQLYIFGGHVFVKEQQKLHHYNDLWALNTDDWSWQRIEVHPTEAAQPLARDRASLVALDDHRLLLFGGADGGNRRLDDCWIFDLNTLKWTEVKPVGTRPRPRCHANLFLYDKGGRVMMFGGDSYGATNDLWSLKGVVSGTTTEGDTPPPPVQQQQQWTLLQLEGTVPTARRGNACAQVSPNWTLFMGGVSEQKTLLGIKKQSEHQSDLFILDRQSDSLSWRNVEVLHGDAPVGREKHTLTALSNGRVFMFGGTDGVTTLGDAWWLELDDVTLEPELLQIYGPDGMMPDTSGIEGAADPIQQSYWSTLPVATFNTLQQGVQNTVLPGAAAGLTTAISSLRGRWLPSPTPNGGGGVGGGLNAISLPEAQIPKKISIGQANADTELLAFGRRLLDTTVEHSNEECVHAARTYLATCAVTDLKLGDIPVLISDYKRCALVGWKHLLQNQGPNALDNSLTNIPGRYLHIQPEEVRMKDITPLLIDYRQLLTAISQLETSATTA